MNSKSQDEMRIKVENVDNNFKKNGSKQIKICATC